MKESDLFRPDWNLLPAPEDDGGASHLKGVCIPPLDFSSVEGGVSFPVPGVVVLFVFPMIARPGEALPDGWNDYPGARGCTPQSCSFKRNHERILDSGADVVYGLSSQSLSFLEEARRRLDLPYDLISDQEMVLKERLSLPSFCLNDKIYYKRLTLVLVDGLIRKVFYPVFPPDENPEDVIRFLTDGRA